MKRILMFNIYKGESKYVGEGVDVPVVTQGDTIDEVTRNIKEALALHLEEEDLSEYGVAPNPSVLVNFELDMAHA